MNRLAPASRFATVTFAVALCVASARCAGDDDGGPGEGEGEGGGQGEGEGEGEGGGEGEGEGEGGVAEDTAALAIDGSGLVDPVVLEADGVVVTASPGTRFLASDDDGSAVLGDATLRLRVLPVAGADDAVGIEVSLVVDGAARLAAFEPPLTAALELGEQPDVGGWDIGALVDGNRAAVELSENDVDGGAIGDAASRVALDAVGFALTGGDDVVRLPHAGVFTIEPFVPNATGQGLAPTQTQTVLLAGDAASRTHVCGWELVVPTTSQVVSSVASIARATPVDVAFVDQARALTTRVTLRDTPSGRAVEVETNAHNDWALFLVACNAGGADAVVTEVALPGVCANESCTEPPAAYAGVVSVQLAGDTFTEVAALADALASADPGATVALRAFIGAEQRGVALYRRGPESLRLLGPIDDVVIGPVETRLLRLRADDDEPPPEQPTWEGELTWSYEFRAESDEPTQIIDETQTSTGTAHFVCTLDGGQVGCEGTELTMSVDLAFFERVPFPCGTSIGTFDDCPCAAPDETCLDGNCAVCFTDGRTTYTKSGSLAGFTSDFVPDALLTFAALGDGTFEVTSTVPQVGVSVTETQVDACPIVGGGGCTAPPDATTTSTENVQLPTAPFGGVARGTVAANADTQTLSGSLVDTEFEEWTVNVSFSLTRVE